MTFDNIIGALIEYGSVTFKDVDERDIRWAVVEGLVSCSETSGSVQSDEFRKLSLHDPDSLEALCKCYEYCIKSERCFINEDTEHEHSPCELAT